MALTQKQNVHELRADDNGDPALRPIALSQRGSGQQQVIH
jgi:hypothetical protein